PYTPLFRSLSTCDVGGRRLACEHGGHPLHSSRGREESQSARFVMGEVAAAIACSFGLLSARGESRTLMGLPPPDFESGASAIPPLGLDAGTQLTAAHGFAAPSREALRSRCPQKRIRAIGS